MPHTSGMAIYFRITEFDPFETCCDERKALCPDCGYDVCVFCEDACEGCGESVF